MNAKTLTIIVVIIAVLLAGYLFYNRNNNSPATPEVKGYRLDFEAKEAPEISLTARLGEKTSTVWYVLDDQGNTHRVFISEDTEIQGTDAGVRLGYLLNIIGGPAPSENSMQAKSIEIVDKQTKIPVIEKPNNLPPTP